MSTNNFEQDWKPLILKKKKTEMNTEVKTNLPSSATFVPVERKDRPKKADFSDVTVPKTVGDGMGKRIQQARTAKGWTQKDLAQKVNVKPADIRDIENGTAVLNMPLISKIRKVLGGV